MNKGLAVGMFFCIIYIIWADVMRSSQDRLIMLTQQGLLVSDDFDHFVKIVPTCNGDTCSSDVTYMTKDNKTVQTTYDFTLN